MTRSNFTFTREREADKAINYNISVLISGAVSSLQLQLKFSSLRNLGIIAKKFERMRSLFFNDFFVDVAIVGSLGPYSSAMKLFRNIEVSIL